MDKKFLTYNQQMKKLRGKKNFDCQNAGHKTILVRNGYFNLVNGYKDPFKAGKDTYGKYTYVSGTCVDSLNYLKSFDENLRILFLRTITKIEEEMRTLVGYKFDQLNNNGQTPWYATEAYSSHSNLQNVMHVISSAYNQLSRSRSEYVKFYMGTHAKIPTWIVTKIIKFSTFIDFTKYSKRDVKRAICNLYNMIDTHGNPNECLLLGSLHLMRQVRNSCAHNERIYCFSPTADSKSRGRILEKHFSVLPKNYKRHLTKNIFDLLVYFKYYLQPKDYKLIINTILKYLNNLASQIPNAAFVRVRSAMGIKNLPDLEQLRDLPADVIKFNRFDSM